MRLWATTSKGLETSLNKELCRKYNVHVEKLVWPGRVLFHVEHDFTLLQLRDLKCAERVFFCLYCGSSNSWRQPESIAQTVISSFYDCAVANDLRWTQTFFNQQQEIVKCIDLPFRVSCRVQQNPQIAPHVAKIVGIRLAQQFNWKCNLRGFVLDVNIQISNKCMFVGIPLFSELAQRSYSTEGLRSTLAFSLAQFAKISPGDICIDPLCGVGTLLLEASQEWTEALYFASDHDTTQVTKAHQNCSQLNSRISLVVANATMLCYRDNSVDRIITDAPFGKKYGNYCMVEALYPSLFLEFARVLRVNYGRLVFLTSRALAPLVKSIVFKQIRFWYIVDRYSVRLGALDGTIFIMNRVDRLNNQTTPSPQDTNTSSPQHTNTSSPQHTIASSPQHTIASSPQHTNTSSPQHTIASSPQHTNTSSPQHTNTSSPQHTNTSSPQHTIASCKQDKEL